MDALLAVFGRAHPLLLHLPIGLFVALAALELVARARGLALEREVRGPLVGLTALAACLAAASGWRLASEPGYGGETLDLHRWLGVGVAACTVAAALGARAGSRRLYGAALVLCAPLLAVGSHFGATMTHGAGFLTAPLRERAPSPAPPTPHASDLEPLPLEPVAQQGDDGPLWSRDVVPILEASCWKCHGPDKQKGGLAMHTPAALLAGGENGPVLVAGDPDASPMLQRAELPLDDDDHMPPEGKPQPSAEDLALLRAWIAAGAIFDTAPDVGPAPGASEPREPEAAAAPAPAQPDADALAALERELVHVEAVPAGSGQLWIDFAATAEQVDDATLAQLVEPLREFVVELSLARTRVADAGAEHLAGYPRLRRLDLRGTDVTDAGVTALAESATLEELVLAQTGVGDAALEALARMPALRHVWLWRSAVTPAGLEALRRARPELAIDDGATPDAAVLESEGKPTFTSDRPLPGQEDAQASGLAPVNTRCPVSGDPVNPKYAVVHDGRVVGFCCPNCPGSFWEDPGKYTANLE